MDDEIPPCGTPERRHYIREVIREHEEMRHTLKEMNSLLDKTAQIAKATNTKLRDHVVLWRGIGIIASIVVVMFGWFVNREMNVLDETLKTMQGIQARHERLEALQESQAREIDRLDGRTRR